MPYGRDMSINQNSDVFAAKQVQSCMGEFAAPTVFLANILILIFVLAYLGMVTATLPLWAGFILASLITYGFYTIMHDAVHGSISGKLIRN